MNMEIWCKSFLSIYNIIPNIINSIDKLVLAKSVASSGFVFSSTQNTYKQLDRIASLTQKKVNLINLKLLCDDVLLKMNKNDSKLIILNYIDNIPTKEIIKLTGLTRRTYFRRMQKALKNFEMIFQTEVLKNNILYSNFSQDDFFNNIFEKINSLENTLIEKREEVNLQNLSNSLCGMILKQMKRVF